MERVPILIPLLLGVSVNYAPVSEIGRTSGAFGALGFLGLSPLFAVAKRPTLRVVADERDHSIQAKSWGVAYSIFWLCFVGASMGVWSVYQEQGAIPVNILPLFPLGGWIVLTLAQSIISLVQYEQGKADAND